MLGQSKNFLSQTKMKISPFGKIRSSKYDLKFTQKGSLSEENYYEPKRN